MPKAKKVDVEESLKTSDVILEELRRIRAHRNAVFQLDGKGPAGVPFVGDEDRRQTQARVEALDEHLAGLAFSGGGIRGATFAVGVLQGLASLGLLRRFDYLSTVSGGGYAGGWLAAWLKRDGDASNVELQLNPNRVEQAEADRESCPSGRPAGAGGRRRGARAAPPPAGVQQLPLPAPGPADGRHLDGDPDLGRGTSRST